MYLSKRKGIYYIFYRQDDGKKTCKSTKTTIKKDAMLYLTNFNDELKSKKVKTEKRLSEFKTEYLKRIDTTHTKQSYKCIVSTFKTFSSYFKTDPLLTSLTREVVEEFLLISYKRTKYGASHYYRTLKAAFNKAKDWGYIHDNPFVKIKLPKIPENKPLFITEDEFDELIKIETIDIYKSIFTLGFFTGCRLGELLHLQWNDIDFQRNEISVKNKEKFTTKSKRERLIPMSKQVQTVLSKINETTQNMSPENYIFCDINDNPYSNSRISKAFKRLIKQSTLDPKLHFHSLRHSFCSNLVSKGVSIYVVKQLAGHESILTTQRYAHLKQQALIDAIDLF